VLHFTRFVGRRVEVSRLKTALRDLADGHGSAWLITGESGVGKTRLLEEVRIRAAVTGVLTLRGQAVASGGLPYQLWREPLRRLLLHLDLSDSEAGVLLEIVSDIADLIGRDVRPAPPLDAQPQQKRLLTTILDLFRRIESPVLMIAEDVQWSVESLEVLRLLRPLTGHVPLMLVASYRDEERPKLADDLGFGDAPHAENVIRLARLSDEDVAEMSASILGDSGRDPEVLSLLRRETEGNAYFITEVVRALVEDAGGITQIGALTLPQHVISGGIRQVINARLRRAPDDARELLILAAAAGREPDLRVLDALRGPVDLDAWLIDCANAAILEFQDGIWRFTHDKLRDALLHGAFRELEASLPLSEAHRRVAQAIEQVYADDLAPHYDDLAFHYHRADDRDGERRFALLAAEQAANRYSNIYAVRHFSRAWELAPPDNPALQFQILSGREKAYGLLGQRESQRRDLDMMLTVAEKLSDRERARAQLREAEWFYNSGDQVNSRQAGERALALAQAANDLELVTIAHNALGQAHWRSADYDGAREHYRQALDLEQRLDQPRIRAVALNGLGIVADLTGDRAASYAHFTAALEIFRQLNSIVQIASSLTNLGIALWRQGKLGEALDVMLESLSLRERSHDRSGEAYLLGNISIVYKALGQYDQALEHVYRGIELARELKNRYTEGRLLLNAGSHQIEMRQFRLAEDLLKDAADVSQASNDRQNLSFCYGQLARLYLLQGDFEAARSWIDQNLELSLAIGDRDGELGGRLMRAMIARLEGEPAQALDLMQACVEVQRAMQPDGRTTDDLLIPLAHTLLELGRDDAAWDAYSEALKYAEIGGARRNVEIEAGMALLAFKRGDHADAVERINVLLPLLMEDMLYGLNEIVLAFLRAADVLDALNDQRFTPLVMRAYEVFQAVLTEASSDLHRRWMVERIPVNAALVNLWQRLNDQS
jgi:predicted ATPase